MGNFSNRAFRKVKHHDRREKLQKIATLIRNNNKKALKSAMPKYRNHIVFQAEFQILKIEKKSLGKNSKIEHYFHRTNFMGEFSRIDTVKKWHKLQAMTTSDCRVEVIRNCRHRNHRKQQLRLL